MRQPSPEIVRTAGRILRWEATVSSAAEAGGTVERVHAKLRGELERIIGPGGWAVLLRRAQVLGTRQLSPEHPEFEEAVLSQLIGILVDLMGENIGLRPLQKIWPGVLEPGVPEDSRETEA